MKMRFWQKTYLFTLVLFLICLNMGIISLAMYTYRKNVSAAENAVSAEQYYIAMSFERDYADIKAAENATDAFLLMQSYGIYYRVRDVYLAFEENGEAVYSNFRDEYSISENTLLHTQLDGKRHILISSEICDGKYDLIFAKNVEHLDSEFRSLTMIYVLTASAVSMLLAVCLYFILKKLSEPLDKLRCATELISSGDFSVTVEEKGNDEFSLLAGSFNSMLAKINEQMASLEREAERKQMLVDNMAHELRTPLTSIHGYAEYIEKANITEERRMIAVKYIMSEAERLQKISEILLDGAFIRGNEIEMSEVDISELLYDTAEKLEIKAENAHVTISCKAFPTVVRGNKTLLSMLIYNLTENAVKACEKGGKVKLSCFDDTIVVEDNGKGMTEEQLLHITEPFYRTDKSRSRADGGAGLGLALCKQIVNTHNAEMIFESERGLGTKIFIHFTTRK
ncbi:MAG: HAMP domain-containing histidine kinase [Ruminococcaceae bacterium]|nr:HAMP domain-containing histidine kinase [Oscillospiraceae bacterium]